MSIFRLDGLASSESFAALLAQLSDESLAESVPARLCSVNPLKGALPAVVIAPAGGSIPSYSNASSFAASSSIVLHPSVPQRLPQEAGRRVRQAAICRSRVARWTWCRQELLMPHSSLASLWLRLSDKAYAQSKTRAMLDVVANQSNLRVIGEVSKFPCASQVRSEQLEEVTQAVIHKMHYHHVWSNSASYHYYLLPTRFSDPLICSQL